MSEENPLYEVATYSKDTPSSRPDLDGRSGVFVPNELFDLSGSTTIRKGSGLAGFGNPDGSLTVYFENNRFDDSSLHKWEDKVRKAYDRMVMNAPTVNKAKIDPKFVEYVGFIDGQGIQLKHPELVQQWLEQSGALDTAPAGPIITWPKSKTRF